MFNVFSVSSDGRHALEMGKNARFLYSVPLFFALICSFLFRFEYCVFV